MTDTTKTKIPTDDEWYAEVVRICKENGYAEWFWHDREAWLENRHFENSTPQEAIDYNLECAM